MQLARQETVARALIEASRGKSAYAVFAASTRMSVVADCT